MTLVGAVYGAWTVVGPAPKRPTKSGHLMWFCRCSCGTCQTIAGAHLRNGSTTCCVTCSAVGHTKHGHSGKRFRHHRSKEYITWEGILYRCTKPTSPAWDDYGGRGITVCDRWRESFDWFLADMGPKPLGLSIERLDNDKGYSPDNCVWATKSMQNRNQRRYQQR